MRSMYVRTGDRYLVHRCLSGEKEAFGLLVEKYKEGVYALAYAKLHHVQDAQCNSRSLRTSVPEASDS